MIKLGEKGKRALIGGLAHYIEGKMDDDEWWASVLRSSINPSLKKIDPMDLYTAFETKMELSSLIGVTHVSKVHNFLQGNEDIIERVKKKMQKKLPSFEWTWIDDWWKKDHPQLRGIVINHPKSGEFKLWLCSEIVKMTKQLQSQI